MHMLNEGLLAVIDMQFWIAANKQIQLTIIQNSTVFHAQMELITLWLSNHSINNF